jgi:hypothetical protein
VAAVAELLGTTVASVNSTLQRANLRRHVVAFWRWDLDSLVWLMR